MSEPQPSTFLPGLQPYLEPGEIVRRKEQNIGLTTLNPAVEVIGSHGGVVAATHCGESCCHPEGDLRGS
jgi:hypothetical protein